MKVCLLTSAQADAIRGQYLNATTQFNPILDGLGRWVISVEEVEQTTNPAFLWVGSLLRIDFVAPAIDI